MWSFSDAGSLIHHAIKELGRTHHITWRTYSGGDLPSYRVCHLGPSRLTNNLWSVSSRESFEIQDQF